MDIDELDRRLALLGVELDDELDDELCPAAGGGIVEAIDDELDRGAADPSDLRAGDGSGTVRGGPGRHGPGGRTGAPPGRPVPSGRAQAGTGLGPDPHALLPRLQVPDGYLLDGRGLLRYELGGDPVPGARLVTLSRAWRFPRADELVWVPDFLVRTVDELAWVGDSDVGAVLGTAPAGDRSVAALGVPELYWEEAAEVPYGVWAPELDPVRMWGTTQVASALGVAVHTVSTYLTRGQMPQPQARVAGAPLWAVPVVWRWQASRPGQGVRARQRRAASSTSSAASGRPISSVRWANTSKACSGSPRSSTTEAPSR